MSSPLELAAPLYQLVEQHYPVFRELRAEAGRPLPQYVQEEFEAYLKCGRLGVSCWQAIRMR